MSNHDPRTEVERVDDLIDDGKAMPLTVMTPTTFPLALEVYQVPRRAGRAPHHRMRFIAPVESQDLEIYVSPTGESVRVFRNGVELT